MRKVGIITLFGLRNYGNRLQAYALSEVIKKLRVKPVEIIYCKNGLVSFLKESVKNNRLFLICYHFLAGILRGNKLDVVINNCTRLRLFSLFSKKIKRKIIRSDSSIFDYYICGSDQIWNPNFAGHSTYFAAFAAKDKRISYAASFGISALPEKTVDRYKKYLTDMRCISVREDAGAQIVKQLTGREAQVLIDPTLMIDKNGWKAVSKKPKFDIQGNYILTYFLGSISEKTDLYVKRIAEENNLKIISLNKFEENDYWHHTGPAEFIWLIENASLVCTDSFHASVFSILMDSPFIVFRRVDENNDMHSRIESLLGKLNLTGRFFEHIQAGDEFQKDYHHISEILDFEREKAINFLKNALGLHDKKDEND